MSKSYQLVVFDWEGTLAEDSLSYLLSILSSAAERLQLDPVDLTVARGLVTLGLTTAVKTLFPVASLHQQEALIAEVQQALGQSTPSVHLLPGAMDAVRWIHDSGRHLAIASNKGHQSLARALHMSGLDVFFQVTRSAGQVPPKPCPQMLTEIMDVFSVDASQTLMVGDSRSDIEMAVSVGVDAVGFDFLQLESSTLTMAGAMQVFDDYRQLVQYLKDE